ncbi:hypothetical protein F4777DRAFT_496238 [Nemania sp. FL0916]|nr:hypothetical protein F4777DRAFT_496238 [Nemania sp. FL0916]
MSSVPMFQESLKVDSSRFWMLIRPLAWAIHLGRLPGIMPFRILRYPSICTHGRRCVYARCSLVLATLKDSTAMEYIHYKVQTEPERAAEAGTVSQPTAGVLSGTVLRTSTGVVRTVPVVRTPYLFADLLLPTRLTSSTQHLPHAVSPPRHLHHLHHVRTRLGSHSYAGNMCDTNAQSPAHDVEVPCRNGLPRVWPLAVFAAVKILPDATFVAPTATMGLHSGRISCRCSQWTLTHQANALSPAPAI